MRKETATFGAGCFWGVEVVFSKTAGVVSTIVGYMGGNEKLYPKPTYEHICTDKTGYAEVVQIVFDPNKISYKKLLDIFWGNHDPTTLNRQGHDFGKQYRSVIFYHSEKQRKIAQDSKNKIQKRFGTKKKVVTQIVNAETFYPAEEYHQKYLEKKGLNSCQI